MHLRGAVARTGEPISWKHGNIAYVGDKNGSRSGGSLRLAVLANENETVSQARVVKLINGLLSHSNSLILDDAVEGVGIS